MKKVDLQNVKIGDQLFVESNYSKCIVTVEKVTKTFVIAENRKFRIKTGEDMSNDKWTYTFARPATDEDKIKIREEIQHRKLVEQCKRIVFDKLSTQQLASILEIAIK